MEKLKRVIINMAPRHTKSEFASYLLPAWMVGRNPKLKLFNQLTPQNSLYDLVVKQNNLWIHQSTKKYFKQD
jgi:hypothetical protein